MVESPAECCAQLLKPVEELLALFPGAGHLAAGAPRQYLFPSNLCIRPAGDVFIQPRSGTSAKRVLHIDQLGAVASLGDAANLTGRFVKSVFCRLPGYTIGSEASVGNPSGWIYRLGHCSLHRSLSLKPAIPRAYGLRDQRQSTRSRRPTGPIQRFHPSRATKTWRNHYTPPRAENHPRCKGSERPCKGDIQGTSPLQTRVGASLDGRIKWGGGPSDLTRVDACFAAVSPNSKRRRLEGCPC